MKFNNDELEKTLKENLFNAVTNSPSKRKRVVDMYGREELNQHLRRYMEYCVAKGMNPDISMVIDWLYSEKTYNERDDFVKIETLIQLLKKGVVLPMLIMEVLEYAKRLEDAAIGVADEISNRKLSLKSHDALKDVLATRLEIRRMEEEEQNKSDTEKVIPFKGLLDNGNNGNNG